MIARHHSGFHS
jgi:hypothetical protein